ncbi:hypothetical protein B7494_g4669 [Chlorociboria aeruginascens]|nr:hypothetical protein B7494_g4669 [Chlorociboria aeruginascens]
MIGRLSARFPSLHLASLASPLAAKPHQAITAKAKLLESDLEISSNIIHLPPSSTTTPPPNANLVMAQDAHRMRPAMEPKKSPSAGHDLVVVGAANCFASLPVC